MKVVENICNNGHGWCDPSYLAIHETSNPNATARNHAHLYGSGTWQYAVQYVVDWTQVVYHCVPDDRKAWAVGNGNSKCVNLEICHATNQEDFDKAYDAAVQFAAWYLQKRGWGMDRLISHDDARRMWGGTDHTDPIAYFKQWGKSWSQFKSDVSSTMANGGYTPKHEVSQNVPSGSTELLRKGSRGEAVRDLQNKLISLGYSVGTYGADAIFGNATKDAVRRFQRDHGLSDDGIVGPLTRGALDGAESGSGGGTPFPLPSSHYYGPYRSRPENHSGYYDSDKDAVRKIQHMVGTKVDGIYGPNTQDRVEVYQSSHGLNPDGLVGPKTWAKMFG